MLVILINETLVGRVIEQFYGTLHISCWSGDKGTNLIELCIKCLNI
jgi:hypothetical protein